MTKTQKYDIKKIDLYKGEARMAISLREAETQKEESIKESINDDKIRELEKSIDETIVKFLSKKKVGFFKKRVKAVASFYYNECRMQTTLNTLIKNGAIEAFLERYRQEGWTVEYSFNSNSKPSLTFYRFIDSQAESKEPIMLEKKRGRVKELKMQAEQIQIELQRLEAELQMLTESPNSRDPQLLEEHR
ncbi:hypothetical protein L6259_02285 [Candidatus Parcubacteria bacterium]|nr:hypothetical protein [Patescibacteria group bacterium]MCG2694077.1 hypothetical protein [Candidatus Parcubacteria bacterium]